MLSTSDSEAGTLWHHFDATVSRREKRRKARPYRAEGVVIGGLAAKGLAQGASRPTEASAEWDVSGRGRQACIHPLKVDLMAHEGDQTALARVFLAVRCRKCEPCLKARSSYWKLGAMAEIGAAPRTWFCTLTFGPEARLKCRYSADLRLAKAGIPNPCAKDVFAYRLKHLSPLVTKFLKRVRTGSRSEKERPVQFRYLLVWEDHKCECAECEPLEHSLPGHFGFPHAHLLLHEKPGQTVTKRRLDRCWQEGFAKNRLVEIANPEEIHKAAAYVCKYIAKSMLSRVRASAGYGLRNRSTA